MALATLWTPSVKKWSLYEKKEKGFKKIVRKTRKIWRLSGRLYL